MSGRGERLSAATARAILAVVFFFVFFVVGDAQAHQCAVGERDRYYSSLNSGNNIFLPVSQTCGDEPSLSALAACVRSAAAAICSNAGYSGNKEYFTDLNHGAGSSAGSLAIGCTNAEGGVVAGGGFTLSHGCEPCPNGQCEDEQSQCPLTPGERIDVTTSFANAPRPQHGCLSVGAGSCRVEKVSDIGLTIGGTGGILSGRLVYKVADNTSCQMGDPEMQKMQEGCLTDAGGNVICPEPAKVNCGKVNGDDLCAPVGESGCGLVNGENQCVETKPDCGLLNGKEFCAPKLVDDKYCAEVDGVKVCAAPDPNSCGTAVGVNGVGIKVCANQVNEGTACVTTSNGNMHCITYKNAPDVSPPKPDNGTPGTPATQKVTITTETGSAGGTPTNTKVESFNATVTNNSTQGPGGGVPGGNNTAGNGGQTINVKQECGVAGKPPCNSKLDETGTPDASEATNTANEARDAHQDASQAFMDSALPLAHGEGDGQSLTSAGNATRDGLLGKLSSLDNAGGCEQINGIFMGKPFVFPGTTMCATFGNLKAIFAWALYVMTILSLVKVATAPKE